MTFIDAPWALTALTQGQFWEDRDFAQGLRRRHGGRLAVGRHLQLGRARASSTARPPRSARRSEIAREVLAQIRKHRTAGEHLKGDVVHSWFLDPGIRWHPATGRNTNATPLLVNTVGTWEKRPKPATAIPNLFVAGDFVQTDVDLASMEGANESARHAVNAILDASGSNAEPAQTWKLYDPPEFAAVKAADAQLYAQGLPNALDLPVDTP